MESKDKKLLHARFGLAVLKILGERKAIADINKANGVKDHKLVSSLRKLSAASGIDFGTIQKISKGYQGFEFFTFIDIIEALELDIIEFGRYFGSITEEEVQRHLSSAKKAKKKK
jgi:hypothetical protein